MSTSDMHIMVDIESLDTVVTAHIVSLGAVVFDPTTVTAPQKTFYGVPPTKEGELNGTVSTSTLLWWLRQSEAARAVFNPTSVTHQSLKEMLIAFVDWVKAEAAGRRVLVWANGTKFDVGALEHHMRALDVPIPWGYNAERDIRTLRQISADCGRYQMQEIPKSGVAHNALHDALYQVAEVCALYETFNY